ncbi:MAG: hypothetical protein ACHQNA_00320 [Acidimicrobiales bacterium]
MSRTIVVATFPGPNEAKGSIAALERAGIKPSDIRVGNDASGSGHEEQATGDNRFIAALSRRVLIGAAVGAVVGAVVVLIGLHVAHPHPSTEASIVAAVGGGLLGLCAGGFIWVALGLPRSQQAWDLYLVEHGSEVCVAVSVGREGGLKPVEDLLRNEGATSVDRLARPPDDGSRP